MGTLTERDIRSINETMKQLSGEASELVGAIKLLNELVDEEEDAGGGADAPHQDV